jgi:hypothetical protein
MCTKLDWWIYERCGDGCFHDFLVGFYTQLNVGIVGHASPSHSSKMGSRFAFLSSQMSRRLCFLSSHRNLRQMINRSGYTASLVLHKETFSITVTTFRFTHTIHQTLMTLVLYPFHPPPSQLWIHHLVIVR